MESRDFGFDAIAPAGKPFGSKAGGQVEMVERLSAKRGIDGTARCSSKKMA
jgi:hypothetical protein